MAHAERSAIEMVKYNREVFELFLYIHSSIYAFVFPPPATSPSHHLPCISLCPIYQIES